MGSGDEVVRLHDVAVTVARLRARENALCLGVLKWTPHWTDACVVLCAAAEAQCEALAS